MAGLVSLLSACGGGGGAGDDDTAQNNDTPQNNDAAIAAIAPLVGVWDLPDDWNGRENDEAYLVISSPDSDGAAEALIFDQDDDIPGAEQNCFIRDLIAGAVTQSTFNESLFLDDIGAFESAIVALLPNDNLEISVFSELAGSGAPAERILVATRLGIAEVDIPICT